MEIVKSNKVAKPEYIRYLIEISQALNKIAEELAVLNERHNIDTY